MHITRTLVVPVGLAACLMLGACDTAPKTDTERSALVQEGYGTLASFKAADPSLQGLMDKSVGYAVFPSVGKAGFIAGGAYGRGVVYEHGRMVGYADISQGTVGLQVGAQSYDELVLFLTDDQLNSFKRNQMDFSANVSAVIVKAGAAAAADHSKGVVVLVKSKGGAMAEASVGGQRFTFQPSETR